MKHNKFIKIKFFNISDKKIIKKIKHKLKLKKLSSKEKTFFKIKKF